MVAPSARVRTSLGRNLVSGLIIPFARHASTACQASKPTESAVTSGKDAEDGEESGNLSARAIKTAAWTRFKPQSGQNSGRPD